MAKTTLDEYHLHKDRPQKTQFEIFDLEEYLHKNFQHCTKAHLHSFYQIIWFFNGKGVHYVDFKKYLFKKNRLFFINKNQVHYFDNNTNSAGLLIHFNESFLVQHKNDIDIFFKYHVFNNQYQKPFCQITEQTVEGLAMIVQQIKRELNGQHEFAHAELLRNYVKSFLIQIEREKRKSNATKLLVNDEKHIQFLRFTELLELNYKKGLSVAEFASLLSVSTKTLADLTNKIVFKTPSSLIKERIILEAKRLLAHSSQNVNEIGFQLGFEDPSYFVKYFKKHTNQSPGEFRKRIS